MTHGMADGMADATTGAMTHEEIVGAIAEVASRHVGFAGELHAGQRLIEDLALDSLRLQVLAAEIENRFRVAFTLEEEAAIRTVGELAAAVEAKLGKRLPG